MTDKLRKDSEQQEILDNILRELETAREQSKAIAEKLSEQTKKMDNTTKNIHSVDHDMDVSGWHLDYLKSTFGKVYKRFNKFPIKDKAKSTFKRLTLKSKLTRLQVDEVENNSIRQGNDKYEEISKTLSEIKKISVLNSAELDKQNTILDYNVDIVDTIDDKMFTNRNKIKKILKK